MKFAKTVFNVAGIYGILVLLPGFFFEKQIGIDYPPAVTHPEYFYGFYGVGLAWQVAFLVIARNPVKFKWFMVPALLEKSSYGIAVVALYCLGRMNKTIFLVSLGDWVFFILFLIAFLKVRNLEEKN